MVHSWGANIFVMAARRHMPIAHAMALRKQHAREVLGGGILITLLATIPVANLFAPLLGRGSDGALLSSGFWHSALDASKSARIGLLLLIWANIPSF